ncbi:MAG: D-sedoheptulose 7-phosphate isomerase [Pseudomonadota bacterium]
MKTQLAGIFQESIQLKERFLRENAAILEGAIRGLAQVIKAGNKVLLFGNGGSAADAQHLAAEFVNRYRMERPPLPAIALTTDTSILTAISNDYDFTEVFEKQVKALGRSGDAAIGISTSGSSLNVVRGLKQAREQGLVTIGLGGPPACPMSLTCDYYMAVDGAPTPRIQEVHLIVEHVLVEMVDEMLFGTLDRS